MLLENIRNIFRHLYFTNIYLFKIYVVLFPTWLVFPLQLSKNNLYGALPKKSSCAGV